MKLVISITVIIFVLLFSVLFGWMLISEKKEDKLNRSSILGLTIAAFFLALLITLVLGLGLFTLFGSIKMTNTLFDLELNMKQVGFVFIAYLIFLSTVDNVIDFLVKHIIGENLFYLIFLLLIRTFILHMIGLIIGIQQTSSFIIAGVVSFIIFLIEIYAILRKGAKEET
ncbi:hypothetical protein KM914_02850 [Virgibacillus pantothenticus]|uniref:hypothetical protein n=1 Tax=Virgibacillus pantothenticus TaxID=1473 RepID=UPI001C2110DA|nr:hypothetical protein [Virgibacillus pantothenticus]MBU8565386.1 hypothetical protein [Virgibacillus pantothenticus]MBU8599395.1 hypothetical protein [Virgibacillus pantothenticus]MBU8633705.1 hypothetical protein [Virgibacillus pantothenticus]MBU8641674.1 hypothetical protein [Virgibacillus pantothenticus]MBU8645586.1 hypothetical protein [Virgibacillus pantothenticus]